MTFDVERMQNAINSGTITLPTGMTHQERREYVCRELEKLQNENPCLVCEDEWGVGTGSTGKIVVRCMNDCCDEYIKCPHCNGTGIGIEPEEDMLTDNQLKGIR